MTTIDPVIDADLDAYIDDELGVERRVAVEAYLSENPVIAARVMADLSIKGELRLALAAVTVSGRPETRDAGRRLEHALGYRRMLNALQRFAAVAVLVGAGWVANASFGAFTATEVSASAHPPAFIDDAVRAYRTTQMRAGMASQVKTGAYNADDIRAATAIVLPQLPKGWSVSDAQVYPSEFGPSVELAIDADGKKLSLFAVRPGSFSVQAVSHVALDGVQAAYWRIGEVAYVLIADGNLPNLDRQAEALSRTLY